MFFRSRDCRSWNRWLMHLLAFAVITAQNYQDLLLNHVSYLQSRCTGNLLQSYLNAQSISRNFLAWPRIKLNFDALFYRMTCRCA
jgi:hypothetical protein